MKIAFLLPSNFIGGGIFFVFEHAKRLVEKGHNVTVVFEDDNSSLDIFHYPNMQDVPRINLRNINVEMVYDCAVATGWQTAYSIDRINAKHYCYLVQDNERNFLASPERCGLPLVEQTYRENFHFITNTDWLREMLRSEFNKAATTVPNSIDFTKYGPEKAAFVKTKKKRILVEGQPENKRKRIPFTFHVLSHIPNVEVFYVSSGGPPDRSWKIDKFFSCVPHSQMPQIYASCDFILKLSSQESFALPVLETFASGGTAVTSAFSGHEAYIQHNKNALVVPIDDEKAAIAAVLELISNDALLDMLKYEAGKTSNLFSWDISSQKMEHKLYEISQLPYEGQSQLSCVNLYKDAFADFNTMREKVYEAQNIKLSRSYRLSKLVLRPVSILRRLIRSS